MEAIPLHMDLLAGLWREAPFTRLPQDAPKELGALLEDVDNPYRIYAIHRASRRHDLQLLIERFTYQLRNGCGSANCSTATCFTSRKRLAGKAPLRRYNSTSARMIAVYLASQDNPEHRLCPQLNDSKFVKSQSVSCNFILPRPQSPTCNDHQRCNCPRSSRKSSVPESELGKSAASSKSATKGSRLLQRSRHKSTRCLTPQPPDAAQEGHTKHQPRAVIIEPTTSRDHRSFTATILNTVAYKMLWWLTPNGLEDITAKVHKVLYLKTDASSNPIETKGKEDCDDLGSLSIDNSIDGEITRQADSTRSQTQETGLEAKSVKTIQMKESNPNRPLLADASGSLSITEAEQPSLDKSPSLSTSYPNTWPLTHQGMTTNIASKAMETSDTKSFSENFAHQLASLRATSNLDAKKAPAKSIDLDSDQCPYHLPRESKLKGQNDNAGKSPSSTKQITYLSDSTRLLPQSLARLDIDIIDFVCDVFIQDGTLESFPTRDFIYEIDLPVHSRVRLVRNSAQNIKSNKEQWKMFNEQALFSVLSNSRSLIASFAGDSQPYDSQTLWYCFVRLTRVAVSLVLHSLWMAAEDIFKLTATNGNHLGQKRAAGTSPLSNLEAGWLLAICFHALVATVPITKDSKTLYDVSRIRATGSVLGGSDRIARWPSSLYLSFDDSFSNELALRLARRLCYALTVRHGFSEKIQRDETDFRGYDRENDILFPLIQQIKQPSPSAARILEFSQPERLLHEARLPTLLLDWARAVLMHDWDGNPEFSDDCAFNGALVLMATLYENRRSLLIGDIQFRVDYFSERLDTLEMCLIWANSTSSSQKHHLLDFPFLFSPETLVFFFRSMNFAQMSRAFEESQSLNTRMSNIVDPGSLITNPHHKSVLQDLLTTACSKYLVLDVNRLHIIQDAFDQLWRREERELLRPLKVHLGEERGEEGFDSGGVQQEFFRLVMAECLDPQYGAFTVDDRTRMAWFTPSSVVEPWRFELMGLLMSLAVYNGLTLPVNFPKALYRKLLGESVSEINHIADGWPDLASGLTTLLEWDEKDGSVEDTFARTYEFSVSAFGHNITRQIGDNWPQWSETTHISDAVASMNADEVPCVTEENRDDYIRDYIQYLTDVSVRPQYQAFERGFHRCLETRSLRLLDASILQSVVEGVQDIDITELRRYTRYVGWDTSEPTIKNFWSIVKKFSDDMKHKLLEFVTASDRVPNGGIKNIQFVIQKNGVGEGEGARLPTAYTCYGTLLLPEYSSKELLRERLSVALENAQGFGFA